MEKLEDLWKNTKWFKPLVFIVLLVVLFKIWPLTLIAGLVAIVYAIYSFNKSRKSISTKIKPLTSFIIAIVLIIVGVAGASGSDTPSDEADSDSSTKTTQSSKTIQSSNSKEEKKIITLKVPKSVTASSSGTAIIEGTTLPNTDVRIGMGIIGDSVTSDGKGKFSLSYDMTNDSDEVIEITAQDGSDNVTEKVTIKQNEEIKKKKAEEDAAKKAKEKAEAEAKAAEAALPIEYKNALRKSKAYSDTMHMSKAGIYDQLTSSYGEGFTAEAAQYAIDNLKADYNKNALE